jgi:type IV pilus biogenesis protein CpaD/CtpE
MKKKVAAVIALLMVATLSVSGCTSTTNTTTNTTSPSPTTHDAVLERFVTAYKGFIANPGIGNGTITD